ncbi:MAG: hypothetical protein ACHP79_14860, partial [Terriglobales bacterium]
MRFFICAGCALLGAVLTLCLGSPARTWAQEPAAKAAAANVPAASAISGQVTFLYCNDLGKASEFYARLLEKKP